MIRTTLLSLGLVIAAAGGALAAGGAGEVTDYDFSFEGPFGAYDQEQLRRGFHVYTEVCSGCHGIKQVYFRNLGDPGGLGLSDDAIKEAAAYYDIYDPEIDDFRAGKPADQFPANVDAGAPDLSLMAKARAGFSGPYGTGMNQLFKGMGGPEYIASLLAGYTGEEKEQAGVVLYENTAYPGGWISMAPPLYGDDVEFEDGAPTDLESISQDVSAFLMWTAEPKMMARKQAGFTAVGMLAILAVMLWFVNKAIWKPIKHRTA